jgi:hypothetical protein
MESLAPDDAKEEGRGAVERQAGDWMLVETIKTMKMC